MLFLKIEPREEWNWIEVVGAPFSPAKLSLTASSSSLCEEREKVAMRNSAISALHDAHTVDALRSVSDRQRLGL